MPDLESALSSAGEAGSVSLRTGKRMRKLCLQGQKGLLKPGAADDYIPPCVRERLHDDAKIRENITCGGRKKEFGYRYFSIAEPPIAGFEWARAAYYFMARAERRQILIPDLFFNPLLFSRAALHIFWVSVALRDDLIIGAVEERVCLYLLPLNNV